MMRAGFRNIAEVKRHYIYTDFWEYFLGEYISTPFVAAIAHTRLTPNQLTLMGICLNTIAGLLFATGAYSWLFLGALLSQVSYVLDFADGQLARYKNMTSARGEWLDILGDAFSDCFIFAGLGYGYYMNTGELTVLYIVIFGCALHPLYCLHRQVRNRLNDEMIPAGKARENNSASLGAFIKKAKFYSINRKLLITLGAVANLVMITMIIVMVMVSAKFIASVLLFLNDGVKTRSQDSSRG